MVFLSLRWSVVVFALITLAFAIRLAEGKLDQFSKSLCPQGWWHTGEFWAHCAYPPVSIFKHGAMYAGYAILALLIIQVAAPALKLQASRWVLYSLMAVPAYHLLQQFSWVEACKLFLVAVVALIFGIGARTVQIRDSR